MQTFLPYPDFKKSASVLDYRRLGKQRVEVWQIYRALTGESSGWRNHPATKMWEGYESALLSYGIAMCDEWIDRGYKDTMREKMRVMQHMTEGCCKKMVYLNGSTCPKGTFKTSLPPWLGHPDLHSSHRAALLAKDPDHYGELGWTEAPMDLTIKPLPYHWPV